MKNSIDNLNDYKPGHKLTCIKGSGMWGLTNGKQYTVISSKSSMYDSGIILETLNDYNKEIHLNANSFKSIKVERKEKLEEIWKSQNQK